MKQRRFLWLVIWALISFSCERENDTNVVQHDISFYTLEDQSVTGLGCKLNLNTAQEKEKIISNDEILSYHVADHYFTLTAAAINRLKKIKTQTPFYLKVDGQVVYSGFLMPGYLSLACLDVIVMDPISYTNNMIWVRYDYGTSSRPINDFRNNAELLATLQQQGKLEK
ncbi:hypothetical protein AHMF7605_20105 [Adhaeribacter arboris]|uniref:Lipoprotein n=1 Tax=Adhaeribacter arboris TaxID=2072846 RepID=A0A2T2YJF6_9BACT|nr:hypothetical protein [Adhaeribacter arboris]PSR55644.1 hypothetical protein AHMF7605_20105 [Adhaeribacter arboris]